MVLLYETENEQTFVLWKIRRPQEVPDMKKDRIIRPHRVSRAAGYPAAPPAVP